MERPQMKVEAAEILLPSRDIAEDVEFWTSAATGLDFRMDQIYPADDPQVATLIGHGLRMRLETSVAATSVGTVRLLCSGSDFEARQLTSPSGTRVELIPADARMTQPTTKHAFIVRRLKDNAPWVVGRAGMHYRDLIPGRLGGAIIASHIRIPDPGPVPDKVHYHMVGFQLIHCHTGWVRLVYEDQGEPFVLRAGDSVIQPPQIRHRVLESSAGLQVVEIGVPAEHLTTFDHEMELPTPHFRPDREWDGQRFVHSQADEAVWGPWRIPGFEARDTGVETGTKGVAAVRVIRPAIGVGQGIVVTSHDSDMLFTFVLCGSCVLHGEGQDAQTLAEGDAYTIPPGKKTCVTDCSTNLSLLEVSLPGYFNTIVHPQHPIPI